MANPNPSPATRFQPGNRLGALPKRRPINKILDDVAKQTTLLGKAMPGGMTVEQAFVEAMYRHAIAGRSQYAQIICDRRWGPVKPNDDVMGDDIRAALANISLERVISANLKALADQAESESSDEEAPA